jgi:hypothetical protein
MTYLLPVLRHLDAVANRTIPTTLNHAFNPSSTGVDA